MEMFAEYCRLVYPHGTIPEQREQVCDAFIAGVVTVLDAFTNEMSEDDTINLCGAWMSEATRYVEGREDEVRRIIDGK